MAWPWWPFWPGGDARTGGDAGSDGQTTGPDGAPASGIPEQEPGAAAQEVLALLRGIHEQVTDLSRRMQALEERTGGG